jgi:hypothetical protein
MVRVAGLESNLANQMDGLKVKKIAAFSRLATNFHEPFQG